MTDVQTFYCLALCREYRDTDEGRAQHRRDLDAWAEADAQRLQERRHQAQCRDITRRARAWRLKDELAQAVDRIRQRRAAEGLRRACGARWAARSSVR